MIIDARALPERGSKVSEVLIIIHIRFFFRFPDTNLINDKVKGKKGRESESFWQIKMENEKLIRNKKKIVSMRFNKKDLFYLRQ
jgi:hypothetical protein